MSDYLIRAFWIKFTEKDEVLQKRKFADNGVRSCGLAVRAFGMKVKVINPLSKDSHGLVVGNHMGFVDILIMASLMPNLFVTSNEMKETPGLGLVTELAGCIYVERRSRGNIQNELKGMTDWLKKGFRITLYPEATSHNGEEILPFKRTLLMSASLAGVPIYPYSFNFISINGEPFSVKHRDGVCYYGDITFGRSVLNLFALKEIVAEVRYLEPYYPKPDEDRGQVADLIRERIVQHFIPVRK